MEKILIITIILVIGLTGRKRNMSLLIEDISDVKYINDNKDIISSVVIHKTTLGSDDCYNVDIEKAYNEINEIKIIKKSNIRVTDDYLSYIFKFDDGTSKSISFEGKYLIYNNESYIIDKLSQIKLIKDNIIECYY